MKKVEPLWPVGLFVQRGEDLVFISSNEVCLATLNPMQAANDE